MIVDTIYTWYISNIYLVKIGGLASNRNRKGKNKNKNRKGIARTIGLTADVIEAKGKVTRRKKWSVIYCFLLQRHQRIRKTEKRSLDLSPQGQ